MDKDQLKQILEKHCAWLRGETGGERANLTGADLTGADLTGAKTAKTILDNLNWLTYIGITHNERGYAYAYKLINERGEGPFNGGINYLEAKSFAVAEVDPDVHAHCSYGIHLATFQWCLRNKQDGYRVLLMRFYVDDAVCPVGSDGKFRVRKCTRVGECDWQGNLIKEQS